MANFHFPETTGSLIVALNSSDCQKSTILVFAKFVSHKKSQEKNDKIYPGFMQTLTT